MTPDQIEAERGRFEAWANNQVSLSYRLTPRQGEGYFFQVADMAWYAWLARAEEQYASKRNQELKEIGIEFIPLDKKRDEFNRLVDECRREESGE